MTPNGDMPRLPRRSHGGIMPDRDPRYPVPDTLVFGVLALFLSLWVLLCYLAHQGVLVVMG